MIRERQGYYAFCFKLITFSTVLEFKVVQVYFQKSNLEIHMLEAKNAFSQLWQIYEYLKIFFFKFFVTIKMLNLSFSIHKDLCA